MLEPVTVWMVELRTRSTLQEVKGILTLGDEALRFVSPANGTELSIPYERARSARRLRMSPVLLVRWRDEDDRTIAFYFAPPPPLHPPERDEAQLPRGVFGPLGGRPPSKRRQRRENAGYLTTRAGPLKPTMIAWAQAVRARIAASQGG